LIAGLDNADGMTDPADAATAAADAAGTFFSPSDCVTALAEQGVVTYSLDNCSGPYGLTGLNGQAVVTYSLAGSVLTANLTSTALSVNDGTMTLNASATLDTSGPRKSMTVQTSTVGVSA